jgi:outer membrane protein TolC
MQSNERGRRRRWLTGCVCAMLALAGCQSAPNLEMFARSPFPERHEPKTPVYYVPPPAPVNEGKPIAICLDTVLRLAQDQNNQVRLARMKVEDAQTDQKWADKHWLPDLSVGMGTWRHDGGIQDFQGNIVKSDYASALAGLELTGKYDWKEVLFRRVEAERRVWQQKGELSKLSSENLLDASTTYIDLLAARSGAVSSKETEAQLRDLLKQAEALAKVEPGSRVEVSRIETELMAQAVLTVKLREAGKASSGKVAYLLGLDPRSELVAADPRLVPITLVDAKQPVETMVELAWNQGPGVRELEGLLRAVEAARNTNYGWSHWLPSIELSVSEGAFGASPIGQPYEWTNRFDLGVHMRWNLGEFVYAKQKRHQADANIQQVRISADDLRAKLTLGVQEARDAINSGVEQVELAEKHIRFAEESYNLSKTRLKENVKGRSTSEVLLALRSLGGARLEYLQAVRDLNKAQLRLFVLVGATEVGHKK